MQCQLVNVISCPATMTMRAKQILTRSFCQTCMLLVILTRDIVSGGVLGPLDAFNSFEDTSSTTTTVPTYTHPHWIEPYFDPTTPRNVTALMGKSAYLSCRVRNLGNKTVSWIRHRDIHILTVGSYTYTSDLRFQATHHQESDDWTLQIKWTQKRDAGMYECQISTQPVRSYFVNLNVVVPTATILGGPDLHVDKGSTINLTCTVKFSPEPPAYIFWYHHEEVINYDSTRGGVSVITEKGDVTTSFLLVQNADLADSGKYSCAPSNADVASVRVHVLNGEHPEAMQTGSSGCQYSWLTILALITLVFYYNRQCTIWNSIRTPSNGIQITTNTINSCSSSSCNCSCNSTNPTSASHTSTISTKNCSVCHQEVHPYNKTTDLLKWQSQYSFLCNQRTFCFQHHHQQQYHHHHHQQQQQQQQQHIHSQARQRQQQQQQQLICTS